MNFTSRVALGVVSLLWLLASFLLGLAIWTYRRAHRNEQTVQFQATAAVPLGRPGDNAEARTYIEAVRTHQDVVAETHTDARVVVASFVMWTVSTAVCVAVVVLVA